MIRLALLGVGGSLAWLLGVAIAEIAPAPAIAEPPLSEIGLRYGQNILRQLRSRSGIVPSPNRPDVAADVTELPSSPSPPPPPQPGDTVAIPPLPADLTPAEQAELAEQLSQLQAEYEALRDRAATLEDSLGDPRSTISLDDRLAILAQQLNPPSPAPTEDTATSTPEVSPPAEVPAAPPATDAIATIPIESNFPDQRVIQITLPSDILFLPNSAQLRPEATAVLDNVWPEFRRYPGSTIQIAGHTDNQNSPAEARRLSLRQARAVQQYITQRLGDRDRVVIIGYGQHRPLSANDTALDQAQNRRIELAVYPR